MKKRIEIIILVLVVIILSFTIWQTLNSTTSDESGRRCPRWGEYDEWSDMKVINCMPGRKLPESCQPVYREWMLDNCPGFSYSF